jgi:hypothetical protein
MGQSRYDNLDNTGLLKPEFNAITFEERLDAMNVTDQQLQSTDKLLTNQAMVVHLIGNPYTLVGYCFNELSLLFRRNSSVINSYPYDLICYSSPSWGDTND